MRMKQVIESGYPIQFRDKESQQLGQYIKQQKSVVLIGMKRVGISNFLRFFINHPDVPSIYIKSSQKQLFVQVDLNDLIERNLSAFWTLLLTRVVDAAENSNLPESDKKACRKLFVQSIQLKDHFFTLDSVRKVLETIVASGLYPTLFLIRFDRLSEVFTEDFFGNLLGLRDSLKQQMSYVFTSHRALPELSPTIFKKQFLTTFTKDMYLPVATHEDMNIIAQTLIDQYHVNPDEHVLKQILTLSGGYVQYMQYALIRLHDMGSVHPSDSLLTDLSSDEQILFQSEELFDSLSKTEKELLLQIQQGVQPTADVKDKTIYLWNTGIVQEVNGTTSLFSPLFASYVGSLSVNTQLGKDFTKKEFALFTYLESHVGALCEREALIDAVWPESHEMGVSDWAVDRLVARLRSKLKAQHSPYQIETVVTRGYKLIKT
jgi:Transcriptional regulatory protein, C terminal